MASAAGEKAAPAMPIPAFGDLGKAANDVFGYTNLMATPMEVYANGIAAHQQGLLPYQPRLEQDIPGWLELRANTTNSEPRSQAQGSQWHKCHSQGQARL